MPGKHAGQSRRCLHCLRRKGKQRILIWQHGKDKEYAWIPCIHCGGSGYRKPKG